MQYLTQLQNTWKLRAAVAIVVVFGLTLFSLVRPSVNASWQPATAVVDQQFVSAVIQENYQPGGGELALDENSLWVRVIPGRDRRHQLYIFDFRTDGLCGEIGCLYAIYTPRQQRVFSGLLDAPLSEKSAFEGVRRYSREGFPCLRINQNKSEGLQVSNLYCYQGTQFVRINRSFIARHPSE
ncbi:MAG: hypothetical protein ACRC8Y_07345 [Chroococcales cyanobacterium]